MGTEERKTRERENMQKRILKTAMKLFLADGIENVSLRRIAEKIEWLGIDPDSPKLDVKKLTGSSYYRLRIGDWRVIYDRDDQIKIISIETIDSRGGVYK